MTSADPVDRPDPIEQPDQLGRDYERDLDPDLRRRQGAFYTPADVADSVVGLAAPVQRAGRPAACHPAVCDPAVGGGAFLLAAARWLEAAGHDRATIVSELLWGVDIDPGAVAVAREALVRWAGEPCPGLDAHVVVGDALTDGIGLWSEAPGVGFDLVVGNPPFLNQLDRRTWRGHGRTRQLRAELGSAVAPYADTAVLFLDAASRWLAPGGRLALVLPESLLAARDAGPTRTAVLVRGSLVGFWWPAEPVFEAAVDVCVPILERGATPAPVPRWRGRSPIPVPSARSPQPGATWSGLLDLGTPAVVAGGPHGVGVDRLGSRATATAGFRDQYYGLVDHVRERDDGPDERRTARLVTAGLIDPLHLRWGQVPARFARRRWAAPVIDLESLAADDPRLAEWGAARLVPKLVVATQTRVLEAVVDEHGDCWPSVPTVAITARSGDPDELWWLAAAVLAPAASAWALARHRGAALAHDALKLSSRQLLELPLPVDAGAWRDGAAWARQAQARADAGDSAGWVAALDHLGEAMAAAWGCGPDVTTWWAARRPAPIPPPAPSSAEPSAESSARSQKA